MRERPACLPSKGKTYADSGPLPRLGKSQKILAWVESSEEPQTPTITLATGYLAIPHYDLDLHVHLGASSSPAAGFPEVLGLNFSPFS